jgi:nickel transport protein
MKIKRLFFIGVVLVFCLLTASSAWGHKVHVFAWVEGGIVHTESYFSNGNKVVNAQIQVFDNYGKLIMSGKTDKKGIFAFKLPACTALRIVLNASEGHMLNSISQLTRSIETQQLVSENVKLF